MSNRLLVLCIFHKEKTPSLRIWPSGRFRCHGCGERGKVKDHPQLFQVFERDKIRRLEEAGQLRFPGFDKFFT